MKKDTLNEMAKLEFGELYDRNASIQEFQKFHDNHQNRILLQQELNKKWPRVWYAGSPEAGVGDIIIQEYANSQKTKLPVQIANEFGVYQQLIELYTNQEEYDKVKSESDQFLFELDYILVYRRFDNVHNYIIICKFNDGKDIMIDPTIPRWIFDQTF